MNALCAPFTAEGRKQRAVFGLEPGAWVLAAQDGQLVTEDQDLHLPGVHRPPASTINSGTRRSARQTNDQTIRTAPVCQADVRHLLLLTIPQGENRIT